MVSQQIPVSGGVAYLRIFCYARGRRPRAAAGSSLVACGMAMHGVTDRQPSRQFATTVTSQLRNMQTCHVPAIILLRWLLIRIRWYLSTYLGEVLLIYSDTLVEGQEG